MAKEIIVILLPPCRIIQTELYPDCVCEGERRGRGKEKGKEEGREGLRERERREEKYLNASVAIMSAFIGP